MFFSAGSVQWTLHCYLLLFSSWWLVTPSHTYNAICPLVPSFYCKVLGKSVCHSSRELLQTVEPSISHCKVHICPKCISFTWGHLGFNNNNKKSSLIWILETMKCVVALRCDLTVHLHLSTVGSPLMTPESQLPSPGRDATFKNLPNENNDFRDYFRLWFLLI